MTRTSDDLIESVLEGSRPSDVIKGIIDDPKVTERGVRYAQEMDRLGHEIAMQSGEDCWCDKCNDLDESNAVAKPPALKSKMKEVSLGRDKKGYYVYTHRARSKSYSAPEKIPDKDIKFISSTG